MVLVKDLEEFTLTTLIYCCKHLQLDHIPWSQDVVGCRGVTFTKLLHNKFLNISGHDNIKLALTAVYLTQAEMSPLPMRQSLLYIVENNPMGDWSALDVGLMKLYMMLHKSVLPMECNKNFISFMTEMLLMAQTLTWAFGQFNPGNNIHKMVLFMSLAVSCMLPRIFTDMTSKPERGCPSTTVVDSYIRQLPWMTLSKKGLSDKWLFILLVYLMFMILYDISLPIRSNNNVKQQWTVKYCESNYFTNRSFCFLENHTNDGSFSSFCCCYQYFHIAQT